MTAEKVEVLSDFAHCEILRELDMVTDCMVRSVGMKNCERKCGEFYMRIEQRELKEEEVAIR